MKNGLKLSSNIFLIIRFSIIALLIPLSGIAQYQSMEGFIISRQNDTVPGIVKISKSESNSQYCLFKSDDNKSKYYKLSPKQIKGFFYKPDNKYKSILITDKDKKRKRFFFQIVAEGDITLYVLRLPNQKKKFYIKKRYTRLYRLHDNLITSYAKNGKRVKIKQYIRLLKAFTRNDSIQKQFKDLAFNEENLYKIINTHNGKKNKLNKISKRIISLESYLSFSYNTSNTSLLGVDNMKASSPGIAFYFGVRPRYANKNISLVTGASIYKYSYEHKIGDRMNRNDIKYVDPHLLLEITYLKIPLFLRYSIPTKYISPYFSIGFSNSLFLINKNKIKAMTENNEFTEFDAIEDNKLKSYETSIFASIGLKKSISKQLNIFFELSYDRGNGITKNELSVDSYSENYSIFLGLSFVF